MNIIIVS